MGIHKIDEIQTILHQRAAEGGLAVLVGTTVSFIPCCKEEKQPGTRSSGAAPIIAKANYVNRRHKWFSAQWESHGNVLRECFKLCDVGEERAVTVVGRREVDKNNN